MASPEVLLKKTITLPKYYGYSRTSQFISIIELGFSSNNNQKQIGKTMEPLDLTEFEYKTEVRQLTIDDFDQLIEMAEACFPGMLPWTRDQIESQLEVFPEGQLCVEVDGRLAASSSSLILEFDDSLEWHNWKAVADSGYIRNHKAKGDTLYGIEIMVHPDFRGMKLSRRMYDARKQLAREKNLERIIIAGRIPGFRNHSEDMSAAEYIARVQEKSLYDQVLTAQISNGFSVKGLIPNYLPTDIESCGFATYLEWTNLEYISGAKRRFHHVVEKVRVCVVQYQMRSRKELR